MRVSAICVCCCRPSEKVGPVGAGYDLITGMMGLPSRRSKWTMLFLNTGARGFWGIAGCAKTQCDGSHNQVFAFISPFGAGCSLRRWPSANAKPSRPGLIFVCSCASAAPVLPVAPGFGVAPPNCLLLSGCCLPAVPFACTDVGHLLPWTSSHSSTVTTPDQYPQLLSC